MTSFWVRGIVSVTDMKSGSKQRIVKIANGWPEGSARGVFLFRLEVQDV